MKQTQQVMEQDSDKKKVYGAIEMANSSWNETKKKKKQQTRLSCAHRTRDLFQ